jgi:hypothetical protein
MVASCVKALTSLEVLIGQKSTYQQVPVVHTHLISSMATQIAEGLSTVPVGYWCSRLIPGPDPLECCVLR